MSSGQTLCGFNPLGSFPPATNYATVGFRSIPTLDFDDTTQEAAFVVLFMPRNYSGGGVTVYLTWAAASATSGTIGWDVAFARLNPNNQDLDSLTFAAAQTIVAGTVNGTSGKLSTTSVAIANGSNMDSVAEGEWFCLRVRRDVGSDTAVGDAQLIGGELKET